MKNNKVVNKSKSKSKSNNKKVYKLKHLPPNTCFEFLSGGISFRNMKLIYSGDARCVVSGYRYMGKDEDTGEDSWKQFEDNCAPDAEVYVISKKEKEKEKEKERERERETEAKKENKEENKGVEKMNNIDVNNDNGRKETRGRKRKPVGLDLPKDKTFTAPELITQLGVKAYVVSNELNKALKENLVEIVGEIPSKTGRGRSCKVFKVATRA